MNKEERTTLRRAVERARHLLEREVADQLEGSFGILPGGKVLNDTPGDPVVRQRLLGVIAHHEAGGETARGAVSRALREIAFTTLNRFVALKMAERRGLVRECISKGPLSDGIRELADCAPGLHAALPDGGYRLLLEAVMDELSVGLSMLFDRRAPTGLIWPRPKALGGLLQILNAAELANAWVQDETLGWVYQYFNPAEERRTMREASQAPRNSRELAVRNQFFTPRYVVAFLTDNTLGRIWYEMRKGETALRESCRYLLRWPSEIFLQPGETAPSKDERRVELPGAELLSRSVYAEHRSKKDPRDINVLDPACGSGHFVLYAFALLERMYEEAWADPESPASEMTGRTLHEDYSSIEELRCATPKLIIEHNVHGIDIDPRAVQIAAFALWLRAQKAWQAMGLKPVERPRVTRCNIVTAEPMPGEGDMRQEFTAGLKPRVLGQLVDVVFDRMKLAGEAGSLLKIEEEIKGGIAAARRQWLESSAGEQKLLFPGMSPLRYDQEKLRFDLTGVDDERFWEEAESRILEALRMYAERVDAGSTFRRLLFAEDAARGFAFIDLCRKRYDVVLMNPPFGLAPTNVFRYLKDEYPDTYVDLYASSVTRGRKLAPFGFVGAITSRAFLTTKKLVRWRTKEVVEHIDVLLDLGLGVMDDAFVEACAYVLSESTQPTFVAFNRRDSAEKSALTINFERPDYYVVNRTDIETLPSTIILYSASSQIHSLLRSRDVFEPDVGTAREGLRTFDDFRFLRLRWEISPSFIGPDEVWEPLAKGGEFARYYSDLPLLICWRSDGRELAEENRRVNGQVAQSRQASEYYRRPGATYSKRSAKGFSCRALPAGCIIGTKGPAVLSESDASPAYILGWLNSRLIRSLIHIQANAYEFNTGIVKRLPWKYVESPDQLADAVRQAILAMRRKASLEETNVCFSSVMLAPTIMDIARNTIRFSVDAARTVVKCQTTWDEAMDRLYCVDSTSLESMTVETGEESDGDEDQKDFGESFESSNSPAKSDCVKAAHELMAYCIGACVGRWDIRIALDSGLAPKLPDPFESLPVCSPGILVGPSGLPAASGRIVSADWLRARPDARTVPPDGTVLHTTIPDSAYPLRICWDGVWVDDSGVDENQPHQNDVVCRVREALELMWKDRAYDIEQEACRFLSVPNLRDYFRRPAGFFDAHLKLLLEESAQGANLLASLHGLRRVHSLGLLSPT